VQQDTHLEGHMTTTRQMDGVNEKEGPQLTPDYDSWKRKQFCQVLNIIWEESGVRAMQV